MPNEKNLVPLNQRAKSEQREIQSMGGIASGVSRRRKKKMKEAADLFLSLPVTDKRLWNQLERKKIDPDDIDNQMAVIVGMWQQAIIGDARAARLLFEILGEEDERGSPVDQAREDELSQSLRELAENLESDPVK